MFIEEENKPAVIFFHSDVLAMDIRYKIEVVIFIKLLCFLVIFLKGTVSREVLIFMYIPIQIYQQLFSRDVAHNINVHIGQEVELCYAIF